MGSVQARAGIFDTMPGRIHVMVRHRHQSDSASPPLKREDRFIDSRLTPAQAMEIIDFALKAAGEWDVESVIKWIQEGMDKAKLEPSMRYQQSLETLQRRQEETGSSIAKAFAELCEEYKGMKFSPKQSSVLIHKRLYDLESWEVEQLLGIRHVPQIEYRIMQAAAMHQRRRTTQRKGRAL
jgi:hypothetical protein